LDATLQWKFWWRDLYAITETRPSASTKQVGQSSDGSSAQPWCDVDRSKPIRRRVVSPPSGALPRGGSSRVSSRYSSVLVIVAATEGPAAAVGEKSAASARRGTSPGVEKNMFSGPARPKC